MLLPSLMSFLLPSWNANHSDSAHYVFIIFYLLLLHVLDLMNMRDFSIIML